jgi:hypothetical protein
MDPDSTTTQGVEAPPIKHLPCFACHQVWPSNLIFTVGGRNFCGMCKERAEEEISGKKVERYGIGLGAPDYTKWSIILTVVAAMMIFGLRMYISSGRRAMKDVAAKLEQAATKAEDAAAGEETVQEGSAVEVPAESWAAQPPEQWPQIMLTNLADLHRRDPLEGASGVLVRGESGALYGVTVSHLLGALAPAGRDIAPASLKTYLKGWTFHRRDDEEAAITFRGVHDELFTRRFQSLDLLVLTKPENADSTPATSLRVASASRRPGDAVFVVGVPYDSPTQKQQVYACTVDAMSKDGITVSTTDNFDPSGFSGAPIVDKSGHLIGLVRGGSKADGKQTITGINARRFAALIK